MTEESKPMKELDKAGRTVTIEGFITSAYSGDIVPLAKEGFFQLGAGINPGKSFRVSNNFQVITIHKPRRK